MENLRNSQKLDPLENYNNVAELESRYSCLQLHFFMHLSLIFSRGLWQGIGEKQFVEEIYAMCRDRSSSFPRFPVPPTSTYISDAGSVLKKRC